MKPDVLLQQGLDGSYFQHGLHCPVVPCNCGFSEWYDRVRRALGQTPKGDDEPWQYTLGGGSGNG